MEYQVYIKYFISLFVICNPFAALPALISLSQGRSLNEKKKIGIIAAATVAFILIAMTWVGGPILKFLGITVPAFQVAGGFVIFLLALSMLNAETSRLKQTTEDQKEARQRESVAIVPLAIPIMAGPGAISTVIVAVDSNPSMQNHFIFSICAVLVAFFLGMNLYFAGHFEKLLGQTGINILNRIAGLILSAMAVETLSKGLIGLFPFLAMNG